jgi:hypothetical protein
MDLLFIFKPADPRTVSTALAGRLGWADPDPGSRLVNRECLRRRIVARRGFPADCWRRAHRIRVAAAVSEVR